MSDGHSEMTAKMGRIIAIVIALSAGLSILAPEIIETVNGEPRHEILIYMFSLAGFVWALAMTWKLWQKTRK